MNDLVRGVVFIIAMLWLLTTGTEWSTSHHSGIAQHVWVWKELYALIAFLVYLFAIRTLTEKAFTEAASYKPKERKASTFANTSRFVAKALVFFFVTVLIWFRSQFLLSVFHYEGASGFAPVVVAVAFGLVFAFWPTTSLTSITYTLVLAHLRALYLVVATILAAVSLTLAGAIAALIIALPISLFAGIAYVVVRFTGGRINPSSTTQILILIGGIAVIIMTARGAWNLGQYMYKTSPRVRIVVASIDQPRGRR
jgi:MFS family permease